MENEHRKPGFLPTASQWSEMVNGNLHFSLAVIASEEEAQKSTSL